MSDEEPKPLTVDSFSAAVVAAGIAARTDDRDAAFETALWLDTGLRRLETKMEAQTKT